MRSVRSRCLRCRDASELCRPHKARRYATSCACFGGGSQTCMCMLYPVKVQGEGAPEEIVRAIRHFNRAVLVDVMIVARGGGSFEDLWAFNEEIVVRAIAASEIPIITGIGHETDTTIADFAADMRAPTPSAAAEIVVRTRAEFEKHIADCSRQLVQQMRYLFLEKRHGCGIWQCIAAFRRPEDLVRRNRQRLDDMNASLAAGLRGTAYMARQRMKMASARMGLFDLRGRVGLLRIRSERRSGELSAALERAVTRKQRRYASLQVRIASLDLRARVSRSRRRRERDTSEFTAQARRYLVAQRAENWKRRRFGSKSAVHFSCSSAVMRLVMRMATFCGRWSRLSRVMKLRCGWRAARLAQRCGRKGMSANRETFARKTSGELS